jgi:hypothetical protein
MPSLNPDGTVNLDATDDDELPPHRDPVAIAHCELCDEDGYRGARVCDHVDRTETAARGHELVQAELARIRRRKTDRARGVDA